MSDITYKLIKKSLDAGALRQKVLANNIANLNTRGFKRSDVVFEEALKEELKKNNSLEKAAAIEPVVVKDNTTSMREDGNNVDIDMEMSNVAANTILYNTLITQLNTRMSIMRHIISEGRK